MLLRSILILFYFLVNFDENSARKTFQLTPVRNDSLEVGVKFVEDSAYANDFLLPNDFNLEDFETFSSENQTSESNFSKNP